MKYYTYTYIPKKNNKNMYAMKSKQIKYIKYKYP